MTFLRKERLSREFHIYRTTTTTTSISKDVWIYIYIYVSNRLLWRFINTINTLHTTKKKERENTNLCAEEEEKNVQIIIAEL